ncbi:MAG: hypothetical protein F9K18_10010 [Thermoanaerobaculia bacterium]|nr:MAG: hypothetical protein F9K18_10010 [Thermoanaerobaculia bacterium]
MKRRQTYTAPGITVTFDPDLCIHSAVCLRTLPAVFDVRRRRWVAPEAAPADEVAAAIERCPSGALRYVRQEGAAPRGEEPAEAPAEEPGTTIRASLDGPLLVEGTFELLDAEGRRIDAAGRAALCRCGGTANQPFCDGTHRRIGFRTRSGAAS